MPERTASEMDGGWKQIIEDYLEEFLRFFFPAQHARIDFQQPCEFLDHELAQLVVGAEAGKRVVDRLVRVHQRDGRESWMLIHVEVQARRESNFAERMCVYNCRIWDRYRKPVTSLALLVDADPDFRPQQYVRATSGCRLQFTFTVVKLLDYKTEAELTADPSPFAIASLVQLRKLRAGGDHRRRYRFKLELLRQLYRGGYEREDVLKLFRFMDYILRLPEELAQRFQSDVVAIEEDTNMPYITSVERLALEQGRQAGIQEGLQKGRQEGRQEGKHEGRQEGRQEGILEGVRDMLLETLAIRFGDVPTSLRDKILASSDVATLRALHQDALAANSLHDLTF